jgi:MFS family permease
VTAASPAAGEGVRAVLSNRPFLLLWLAQASTQIGANMVLFGLTVIVVTATRSNAAVSALILTFLVPAVLFSAVAGVYVDRIDRRLILIVTNLVRAFAFIGVFLAGDHLLAILVLNVFISTVTVFFAPAEAAMIPALVPRKQLMAANGIFTLTLQGAFALGFALLGPFVVAIAGPQALILLVAALFFVAAGFCVTLPPNPPGSAAHGAAMGAVAETEKAVESTFAQLREGLAYIRAHPSIRWSLVYLGIAASLVGVLGVLGPDYAQTTLGLDPENWVIVVLPLGLGIVTGILFLNSYGRYMVRRRLIEVGLVLLGLLLAVLSIAGPFSRFLQQADAASGLVDLSGITSLLAVVVAVAFFTGAAYGVVAIPSQTQLQEDLPEDVRGRVFGVLFMLISVASFLPIIIVGPISDVVGTTTVLFTVALLIGASGIASIVARGPMRPAESMASAQPTGVRAALDPLGTAPHADPPVPHSKLARYADPYGLGPEPDVLEAAGPDPGDVPVERSRMARMGDPGAGGPAEDEDGGRRA